jgi:uncharacterized membrane protein YecN with MAPEG domain
MLQGLLIAILIQSLLLALLCFSARKSDHGTLWLGGYLLTIAVQRIMHLVIHYSDFIHQHVGLLFTYECLVIAGYWCLHRAALSWLGQRVS